MAQHGPILCFSVVLAHYIQALYKCQALLALVITQKLARLRESGLLDECAPQILRCAQDDTTPRCHPERSEGSLADLWGITSKTRQEICPKKDSSTLFISDDHMWWSWRYHYEHIFSNRK